VAGFDGYFTRLNVAWERTLGFTNQELMKEPFLNFVHPDDREATIAQAKNLESGRDTISFENRYRCKDGSYKWLLWTATSCTDQHLLYASAHEITARKGVEAMLLESEERFRNLANNISQLAWMADETGCIFWYNQRWFDYSGTTLEEMQGWDWQKVHHPDHVKRVVDKINHCFHDCVSTSPLNSFASKNRGFG
jgi:PAS domain S-box-containing protein